jgi:short-subunit dehydrogenase
MTNLTALITGASSGIGLELAKKFAAQGHPVILLARNQEKLEHIALEIHTRFGVPADVIAADLFEANAPKAIYDQLKQRGLKVDILVNNAGFGLLGAYAVLDLQQQMNMIQVNVVALAQLTRLFLPEMIQRDAGGILNVASTAAFQAGPNMAVYYASKAFVLSFTEALHEEVAHTQVHVSCLCPGPTHTGFLTAAKIDSINLFKFGAQSPAEVASVGYTALQRNQAIAIPHIKNKLLTLLAKLSPRFLTRKIAMHLNQ